MAKKVALVVAAHPDDEVLGCGGTMAKLADDGFDVRVVFLADGEGARMAKGDALKELKKRRAAADKACAVLGAKVLAYGDFPDNRMDSVDLLDVVKVVEGFIAKTRPEIVLTHHVGDLNVDHRVTHQAVITACRPQKGRSVRTILCFEVPSSTEWQAPGSGAPFEPNWFVDTSKSHQRKMKALQAYAAELRAWPHPRSEKAIEHLARWRGATVGADAAEAFVLARALA